MGKFAFTRRLEKVPSKKLNEKTAETDAAHLRGIRPGQTVLEVGMGLVSLLPDLSQRVGSEGAVFCLCEDIYAIEYLLHKRRPKGSDNVEILLWPMHRKEALPIESASIDHVIGYLPATTDGTEALTELVRIVKPTGRLHLKVPTSDSTAGKFLNYLTERSELKSQTEVLTAIGQPNLRFEPHKEQWLFSSGTEMTQFLEKQFPNNNPLTLMEAARKLLNFDQEGGKTRVNWDCPVIQLT